DEVLVTLLVFTKNNQMIRTTAGGIAIEAVCPGDVHFAANDRLDACLVCSFVESDRPEQIAMIGDGDRGHFVFRCSLRQRVVIARAIKKTESRVQMEMNKG